MESILEEDITDWDLWFSKEETDLLTGEYKTYDLVPGGSYIAVTQVI